MFDLKRSSTLASVYFVVLFVTMILSFFGFGNIPLTTWTLLGIFLFYGFFIRWIVKEPVHGLRRAIAVGFALASAYAAVGFFTMMWSNLWWFPRDWEWPIPHHDDVHPTRIFVLPNGHWMVPMRNGRVQVYDEHDHFLYGWTTPVTYFPILKPEGSEGAQVLDVFRSTVYHYRINGDLIRVERYEDIVPIRARFKDVPYQNRFFAPSPWYLWPLTSFLCAASLMVWGLVGVIIPLAAFRKWPSPPTPESDNAGSPV